MRPIDELPRNRRRLIYRHAHSFAEWASTPHGDPNAQPQWLPYRYLVWMSRLLCAAILIGGGRFIINVPPRHGKSTLISHWFPIWFMNCLPHMRLILCSVDGAFASDIGGDVRNEILGNPKCWAKLRADSTAKGRWNTDQGGGMYSKGVGGKIIGRGFNVGVIDDPHGGLDDASSYKEKKKLRNWFEGTFMRRAEPFEIGGREVKPTVFVVMQRWCHDDFSGYLINENGEDWKVIRLPALAEADDPIGREEGEALCPQRFTRQDLLNIQKGMDALIWDAVYQQHAPKETADRVYTGFVEGRNVCNPAPVRGVPLDISFDFNVTPGMHAAIGQYLPVSDEITAFDEIHQLRMRIDACLDTFVDRYKEKIGPGKDFPHLNIFGDASGSSDSALTVETYYTKIQERMRKEDIPYVMNVPAANPLILESQMAFNDALKSPCAGDGPVYKIHKRCTVLIEDLAKLPAGPDGKADKSIAKLGHISDAERYRVNWYRPVLPILDMPDARFGVGGGG